MNIPYYSNLNYVGAGASPAQQSEAPDRVCPRPTPRGCTTTQVSAETARTWGTKARTWGQRAFLFKKVPNPSLYSCKTSSGQRSSNRTHPTRRSVNGNQGGLVLPAANRRTQLATVFWLLLLFALPAHATDLVGKVTTAQGGEPLGKVQVSVVGTTLAAITANDGTFQIANAPAGKQVLQVSAVGYRSISIAFESPETGQIKDFAIALLPDNFQRTEKVEVHADIFQSPDWPSVGDMTLTSSELQQTSTVLINDPFRSLQALPGVSASANNDLFAQFSVIGAPFEQVGIYVDDVFVLNLRHTVVSTPDAPTLSLLTGGDVADMRLMPVAFPVRYADNVGAAVVIRTREGDPSPPLIHAAVGLATSEFLGQGAFGSNKKATWLLGARKSYIGYLERYFAGTPAPVSAKTASMTPISSLLML